MTFLNEHENAHSAKSLRIEFCLLFEIEFLTPRAARQQPILLRIRCQRGYCLWFGPLVRLLRDVIYMY